MRLSVFLSVALFCSSSTASAAEWFVKAGSTGTGSQSAPFGKIQEALNVAQAGDVVSVLPGTYAEALLTMRNGTSTAPITLRALNGRGTVLVTVANTVLNVRHAHMTVQGLVMDAKYAAADAVRVQTAGHYFTLRDSEVRRTTRDGIDMTAPEGVLIENSLVHRSLNAANGRTDAHGIVAGPVKKLTIRNTEVHTFSGDAFQVDPGRSSPGWNDVLIEGCRFWLQPLTAPENGFAVGIVPGENAVDTKAALTLPRSRITIRDTVAYGFRNGLIGNMAAFNLKENIDATVERVSVYDSEIAFRLRGAGTDRAGALVRISNAVVYSSLKAFRYENQIDSLRIWNTTVGAGVGRLFEAASATATNMDVRNLLVLGSSLPAEASHPSNLATGPDAFTNAGAHNYTLVKGARAIDAGASLPDVTTDRQGTKRPQGSAWDVGAYEFVTPPPSTTSGEIVLHASSASVILGLWTLLADQSAAGGIRLHHPDLGEPANKLPLGTPVDFFEISFHAEAGKPYRLWMRGQAQNNSATNDSVFVQFSGSLDKSGAARYRIGTTAAAKIILSGCDTCPLSGWGWQDHGYGTNVLGPVIYFATTGLQTIRVQTSEDGVSIDQIVLSPAAYLLQAPGAVRDDTTILLESRGY